MRTASIPDVTALPLFIVWGASSISLSKVAEAATVAFYQFRLVHQLQLNNY